MNISAEQKNVPSNGHDPSTNDGAHIWRALVYGWFPSSYLIELHFIVESGCKDTGFAPLMGLLITEILTWMGSQGADGERVLCALRAPSLPPRGECSAFNKPDGAGADTDLMEPLACSR